MKRLIFLLLLLAASPVSAIDVPDGFVLQTLQPTGGKMACPKDWFYSENHHGPVLEWIISKESTGKGPYQTGLKIQTFVGIKKGTGKTPKEFCLHFLSTKQNAPNVEVLNTFPEADQGLFKRQGIEVEEPITRGKDTEKYHLIYTVFWTDDTQDVGIIFIAGSPAALWPQYLKTFQVMSAFELFDPNKLNYEGPPVASPPAK